MHSSNTDNREDGSGHQRISPNDNMEDSKPRRFESLRQLFRSHPLHHPSSSRSEAERHRTRRRRERRHSSSFESRGHPDSNGRRPGSKPTAPAPKSEPGTRGLFVPAYRAPEHFSQRHRRNNPSISLPVNGRQRSNDASQVAVRFFHCENRNLGRESLTSPDVQLLVSAAVAFLAILPHLPNPAYRGLSLQGSHGGYHLHFPDHAGLRPFHRNVSADWDRIRHIHARDFPNTPLLVGVGLGEPGRQCC
ncbi:hypothetical protein F4824DRAFT_491964 [Ustulina deusta]|nr:hypothetical protein F4824DRAFT_491964 [Ustulina deusta]